MVALAHTLFHIAGMFHIIDDEEMLCELAVELLTSAGYKAMAYSNPIEYINYVYSDNYISPIAVFTDIRMPSMSGHELIDKVREKFPEQKMVVISGYDESNGAFRKKACHFLPKPYFPEKLIAIADALVKCDIEIPVKSTCESLIQKSNLDLWQCPLDCLGCGNKDLNKAMLKNHGELNSLLPT